MSNVSHANTSVLARQIAEAFAEQAIKTLLPVVSRTLDFRRGRMSPFLVREGIQAVVSVPLVSGGACTGVLDLGMRLPRTFPPDEIDLLTSIGRQLASAVQNARLYDEAEHRASRLAVLNRIARVAGATLDVDQLLEAVYRELMSGSFALERPLRADTGLGAPSTPAMRPTCTGPVGCRGKRARRCAN